MIVEDVVTEAKITLAERGWIIVDESLAQPNIEEFLEQFGKIVPQLNGKLSNEITLKPGYEALPFSQSQNGIGPHTEAPVYEQPPHYLVLHCHVQAKCGQGHTELADCAAFFESLPHALQRRIQSEAVTFRARPGNGGGPRQEQRFPLVATVEGRPLYRFSYNQFRFGDVNPAEDDLAKMADAEPWLGDLAKRGEQFFLENRESILIPDRSIFIWDNHRYMHARGAYKDPARFLTRYWLAEVSPGVGHHG